VDLRGGSRIGWEPGYQHIPSGSRLGANEASGHATLCARCSHPQLHDLAILIAPPQPAAGCRSVPVPTCRRVSSPGREGPPSASRKGCISCRARSGQGKKFPTLDLRAGAVIDGQNGGFIGITVPTVPPTNRGPRSWAGIARRGMTPDRTSTLSATAALGSTLVAWTGCDTVEVDGTCTMTMSGDKTLMAAFDDPLALAPSDPARWFRVLS
jgi:hypothetical protein